MRTGQDATVLRYKILHTAGRLTRNARCRHLDRGQRTLPRTQAGPTRGLRFTVGTGRGVMPTGGLAASPCGAGL
jgi:hypothetical protein